MKENVFCAFCQLPQSVYRRKHIHPGDVFGLAIAGAIATYLIWQDFHWAGVFLFAAFVLVAELIYQTRWRVSVRCKNCGFDPLVYKRDPEQAAQQVRGFLEERKKDPLYLLKPQPKIQPIIKKVKNFKLPDKNL